nr:MAG TPA: hypothetical protein [Bacteriophage sp.]
MQPVQFEKLNCTSCIFYFKYPCIGERRDIYYA